MNFQSQLTSAESLLGSWHSGPVLPLVLMAVGASFDSPAEYHAIELLNPTLCAHGSSTTYAKPS